MLKTERLLLRPFTIADAEDLQRLAGDREVARTTLLIPHPYPDGAAEEWIQFQSEKLEHQRPFAITLGQSGELIGAIGLVVDSAHRRAEMGYWIGVPYWNRGYASEAAAAIVGWGFEALELERVFAMHFSGNAASGRVLAKLGMTHEGSLRQHAIKWDQRVDVEMWGILREEWVARANGSRLSS